MNGSVITGRVHPDVRALLAAHRAAMFAALDAHPTRPAGSVIATPDGPVHDVIARASRVEVRPSGCVVAVGSIALARELAAVHAPAFVSGLAVPLPLGETWCLVLGRDRAAAVPIIRLTAPVRALPSHAFARAS